MNKKSTYKNTDTTNNSVVPQTPSISWFPGHMAKAMRIIEDNMKIVDAVVYVLDSRAVSACINPSFDSVIKNKPILYVLNKCDLVEKSDLDKWCAYFEKQGYNYITANSANGRDAGRILKKLTDIMAEKIARYRAKGVMTPIRAMVVGIPNSGKSTLINCLCGGKKTITGDRPGVTKSKQWLAVAKGVDMLDTPGTLWPKMEDQTIALHLAFIGSIKDEILDSEEIAFNLTKFLYENHRNLLNERYGITIESDNPTEIIEEIARKRGYVVKGGEVDTERTSKMIVDDFRKQKIGKIMLEYPEKADN